MALCQQGICISLWFCFRHVLFPEPVHLGRIDDTRVLVLLITSILVFVSWEQIWVTGDRDVQDLSDDTRFLFVACHEGKYSCLQNAKYFSSTG